MTDGKQSGLDSEWLGEWMAAAFARVCGSLPAPVSVAACGNPAFGDYQCNAAMAAGKAAGKPPREIAQAVIAQAGTHPAVTELSLAGPGFINIRLADAWLAEAVAAVGATGTAPVPDRGRGRVVVMDYGSPNISKPLHIGHLRSHNIGSTLDRLHRALGFRVIADNHLGDWGTQFGITIMGYRHFGHAAAMEATPLEELERVYVASYEKGKSDPAWMDACRAELVKLQSGDAENLRLWEMFIRLSLAELERTYARLGVRYDLVRGESYYRDKLAGMVDRLESAGLARESEGALVAFLEEEKLPPCIVRKSDGGFNYASSDIATLASRIEEFRPERIIYVTDERQQLHFRQVFAIARRLGITEDLQHVWFGLMRLPDATFSTREGNVIRLDALLDEAERRALAIVQAGSPGMDESTMRQVARSVGIGAVKYADLSQNPQTLVTFTWDKALSLDGNSGPYLQYAYARICSVLDKYSEQFPGVDLAGYPLQLGEAVERDLALKVLRFGETVAKSAETYRPSMLADYLYELCQGYSSFYQNLPFLKAPAGVRESRLRLCQATAVVLRRGLELLGLDALARI